MTASRLRPNVITYFDVCCEVQGGDSKRQPSVKVLYPPEYSDDSILQSIRQFCFPTQNERSDGEAVQLFTFVLTDAQSQYTFGYCRMMPVTNTCLCILSGLTWTTHFYKFLNHLSNVINTGTREDLESLLTNAYHIDIPESGGTLRLNACTEIAKFSDEIPNASKLPMLRNDKYLLEFYNAVSEKQMIALYASILKERRIIFTGRKLSQLSSCVFALSRLLYPFYWQNLFIPVLPQELTDMLMAPMPYLIGVPKSTFLRLNKADLGEIVVVDLEEKTFDSPNVDTIPSDALSFLRNQLKSSSEMFLSDGLARAFLQTNVLIFGKYAHGFVKEGSIFVWNKQAFVENQRASIQPFLSSIISRDGVQYFERFVEERLDALNKGIPIEDEFEKVMKSTDLRRFFDRQANAVKENASEVIVALKDRVQAISIKDKFGRFTPKEVRRQKLRSAKPSKKKSLDPLSIDAAHYNFNNPLANGHNGGSGNNGATSSLNGEAISDAESVCSTGDLIDLFDDKDGTEQNRNLFSESSPLSSTYSATTNGFAANNSGQRMMTKLDELILSDFLPSSPQNNNTHGIRMPTSAVDRPLLPPAGVSAPNLPSLSRNGGIFVSSTSESEAVARKNIWETFE